MSTQSVEIAAVQHPPFFQYPVQSIGETLDRLDLADHADELVVVGGAAMAAYGLKTLQETDIDLVVTEDLKAVLSQDDRWKLGEDHQPGELMAERHGVATLVTLDYKNKAMVTGDVTAFVMPLDENYWIPSRDLISQGMVSHYSPYRFATLPRILNWKLTLFNSTRYTGDKTKHLRDATRISRFLVRREEIAAELTRL